MANVIARSLSDVLERLWRLGEFPDDWGKENATAIFRKGKNGNSEPRAGQPHLGSWKNHGVNALVNHFWANEEEGGEWKYPV